MFISTAPLLAVADRYRALAGIEKESTVSYRIFTDTRKLSAVRAGTSGLTIERYNAAMRWLRDNWPEGHDLPPELSGGDASPPSPAENQHDAPPPVA